MFERESHLTVHRTRRGRAGIVGTDRQTFLERSLRPPAGWQLRSAQQTYGVTTNMWQATERTEIATKATPDGHGGAAPRTQARMRINAEDPADPTKGSSRRGTPATAAHDQAELHDATHASRVPRRNQGLNAAASCWSVLAATNIQRTSLVGHHGPPEGTDYPLVSERSPWFLR